MAAAARQGGPKTRSQGGRLAWDRPRVEGAASRLLARDRRWRRPRSGRGWLLALALLLLGLGGVAYAALRGPGEDASNGSAMSAAERQVVLRANALFPEALAGESRADALGPAGRYRLRMVLPAHLLAAPGASRDPFERLAAPWLGEAATLDGREIGARLAKLTRYVAPVDGARCYNYRFTAGQTLRLDDGAMLRVRPIAIDLRPGC